MSEADLLRRWALFEEPAAELAGKDVGASPARWPGWREWGVDRWPSFE
ncbi:hypothetical protein [Actinacidiphila sp. bgisy160]